MFELNTVDNGCKNKINNLGMLKKTSNLYKYIAEKPLIMKRYSPRH